MSASEGPAVRCAGVTRTFGSGPTAVPVLAGVDLEVAAGELVVLRGPSGSGKTTLLNVLGGLDVPTSGQVWVAGELLDHADEDGMVELRRHHIGYVFQSFALLPVLTAAENLDLPLRIAGVAPAERADRVASLLDDVGLADHAAQRPDQLSGGQQQRLGIARALANRPALLLADEPTGQLDTATGTAMMTLLHTLVRDHRVAALVSTHDARVAERADRVLDLRGGRLVP